MPRCPNCGREAARTADWACQWCGYPLLSESYKKIPQTWKELQDEKLTGFGLPESEPEPMSEPEAEPLRETESEPVPELKTGYIPDYIKKQLSEPEAKALLELESESMKEPKPKSLTESIPEPLSEPEVETPLDVEPVLASGSELEPKPKNESEPIMESESVPSSQAELQPVPEPQEEISLPVIELTAEELISAYLSDDASSHERFTNRTLKITGVVDRIIVNNIRDVYQIILTGGEIKLRDIECRFNRDYAPELSHLAIGQTITVHGKYFGYVINIILRDCVLVN
ncbi:hypothetical protein ACFLYL_01515 [Chloroflexota bacterium]